MSKYNIVLIEGDGIGPELINSARTILQAIHDNSEIKFCIIECEAGDGALRKFGQALPSSTVDAMKNADACLKGPVGESAADVVIVLRRELDLYANVRPAKTYPNVKCISPDVDLVTIRENTEDLYVGWEFNIDDRSVIALRLTTERASLRIAEFAFRMAIVRNKKKRVVAVHKANVLRKGDGIFVNACRSVAKKYPQIDYSESYVDACAMNLIRDPGSFDVILTTNLFGDILSDEAAQVVGGLGMGPAANIGNNFGLFEPVHGAAFDIAGKNIANPSSIILSVKLMLEWLSYRYENKRIYQEGQGLENAIIKLMLQNRKTRDLGGNLSTSDFTALIAQLMYH